MEQWIQLLKQVIPSKQVLTDLSDRYSYSFDASFGEHLPEAVVQAKSNEEVIGST